jgi:hypothetical protein
MIMSVHIYSVCKTLGTETTENWNSYIGLPKSVCEHEDITLIWNQGVQTDREVLANRPDTIIKIKKDKICLLMHVAIPSDRNVHSLTPNFIKIYFNIISVRVVYTMENRCY